MKSPATLEECWPVLLGSALIWSVFILFLNWLNNRRPERPRYHVRRGKVVARAAIIGYVFGILIPFVWSHHEGGAVYLDEWPGCGMFFMCVGLIIGNFIAARLYPATPDPLENVSLDEDPPLEVKR